jgi:hypothetical protein
MSIIKLTKQGNPVLVNFSNVTNVESAQTTGGVLTKIYYTNGNYILVEESMETIYNIYWSNTKQNEIDWTSTSLDEGIQNNYVPRYQQRPRIPRDEYRQQRPQRNFNTYNSYNDNSY